MGSVLNFARDKLVNLVSGLGTGRDKASLSGFANPTVSDQELIAAYRGSWLARKIVDVPALDSCRKWRDWQADGTEIENVEAEENRLNLKGKVLEARIKARLFGGAAIFIGDGSADASLPFDPESIGKDGIKYLTVMTRRQLTAGEIDLDPASEWFNRPGLYTLTGRDGKQIAIHPSRLVTFHGATHPDDELAMDRGWGESVLIASNDAIKNAEGTAANVASLIYEAKVDVIRIPNFMASLAGEGYSSRLLERFSLATTAKGINGTLILDMEEEYTQKSASFAQLPEIMRAFLEMVAGAADVPLTRLLGTSPGGMNATGESDVRNYYDRIQATQTIEMTPAMHRLDEALIRSALGDRPDDVHYIWSSLWQISDKERSEIGASIAATIEKLNNTGLFPPEALALAGATTLVEHSILPGLEAAIDEAGGLPDYEMEAEKEAEAAKLAMEAKGAGEVTKMRRAANDASPRSLYVRRNVINSAEILAWAKAQGFETTLPAADLHVTIAFSREPVDWMKVGETWSCGDAKGQLTINPGGPRLMEQFGKATVLLFNSSDLSWRHMAIREAGASWDHPEYQPHITISYEFDGDVGEIEPYRGKIVLGPEIFEEVDTDWEAGIKEE